MMNQNRVRKKARVRYTALGPRLGYRRLGRSPAATFTTVSLFPRIYVDVIPMTLTSDTLVATVFTLLWLWLSL